jgi:hypothetical protein
LDPRLVIRRLVISDFLTTMKRRLTDYAACAG